MSGGGGDEAPVQDEGVDLTANYKKPAMKSVNELRSMHQEDPALTRMKQQLLPSSAPIEPDNPKNVLVRSLVLVVEDRPEIVMDLSDVKNIESNTFVVKEGCHYRLKINFHVQREIVSGLKYIQKASRAGVQVDKDEHMVGSYAPKSELQSFTTPLEEAPTGMLHRGTYKIKSHFTDDDDHEWLKWEWSLEIKKDWS